MDISQLRCYLAVADELHFGRAAQRLHLTPSPVSRAVKDLEAELGVQLFIRSYHQVDLTDAGRELVSRVRSILDHIDQLKPAAQRLANGQRVIRIGAAHLAPPQDVDRFLTVARETGGFEAHVEFASSNDLLPALASRNLDVALVHLPVHQPGVCTVVVARHRFKLVMRADDPLARSDGLHLADLADRVFALPAYATQPPVIGHLHHMVQAAGIRSVQQMPTTDIFMLAAHIRQNRTVSITAGPELGGPSQVFGDPAYAVIDLLDDIFFDIGAVYKQDVAEQDLSIGRLIRRLAEISPVPVP